MRPARCRELRDAARRQKREHQTGLNTGRLSGVARGRDGTRGSRRPEAGPAADFVKSGLLALRGPQLRLHVISMSTFCEVGSTGRDVCAAKLAGGWPDTGRPLASAGSGRK